MPIQRVQLRNSGVIPGLQRGMVMVDRDELPFILLAVTETIYSPVVSRLRLTLCLLGARVELCCWSVSVVFAQVTV